MILLLDNFDSFAYNLARYLRQLGAEPLVRRSDAVVPDEIAELAPDAIVISPGPCTPNEAGNCLEIVAAWRDRIPMLGICLGHQVIIQCCGGRIVRAPRPVHGSASPIFHHGQSVFSSLPNPIQGGRYHSLVADRASLPAGLQVTAWLADGTIMAVSSQEEMLVGLQFHPESMLTEGGYWLLSNFLKRHRIALSPTPGPHLISAGSLPEAERGLSMRLQELPH
ncbi:MAG TPA: aminodeoxychorismate/anthranilate synthase component II [Pirellulaceae bacterium]|nr:aminodeoxychorismate/anthranilate synthase component II [Pirellulaceae bacterium]